jgi:hypothetical protein
MITEKELIESLKTTISVQADLIAQLKLQIESLKASQLVVAAPSPTNDQPLVTYPPFQQQPYWTSTGPIGSGSTTLIIPTLSGITQQLTTSYPLHANTCESMGANGKPNIVSLYDASISMTPPTMTTEASIGML